MKKLKALLVTCIIACGVLVLGGTAEAHTNVLSLAPTCVAGAYHVGVHITNDSDHSETVTLSGAVSSSFPLVARASGETSFTRPGGDVSTVTVTAHGVWSDGFTEAHDPSVSTTLAGNCVQPTTTLPTTTTVPPTTTRPPPTTPTTRPPAPVPPPVVVLRPKYTG